MVRTLIANFHAACPTRRLLLLTTAACCVLALGAGPIASPNQTGIVSALNRVLGQPLALCFLIIGCGMTLGSLRLGDISLGTSGVLFAGLVFGHFGREAGWKMPPDIGSLGLVLFVYSVGLGAGPTFFRTFRDQGRQLAFLGLATVSIGAAATCALAWWFALPGELATGLFAGSLTSTPALASGLDAAAEMGLDGLAVSIGYGLSYPVGVVGVVLFVQLMPRLLRINLSRLGDDAQRQLASKSRIDRYLVKICNPAVFGKHLHEIPLLEQVSGQITRVLDGDQLVPIRPDHIFAPGQVVLLVTDTQTSELLTMILGEPTTADVVINADRDRASVVVTSHDMLNKPLRDLHLRSRFGITVARIERYGVDFVPNAGTAFSMADKATVVGEPEGLKAFEKAAGHRLRRVHETDLMSLGLGLAVGIVLGMVPLQVPGLRTFTLGLAGGPLLAGLLFAHFGRVLGIVGHMPIAARMLTQNMGLAFFLAAAGFDAGGHLGQMLSEFGLTPFLVSILVKAITITAGFGLASRLFRLDFMQALGGMCGAMTSTVGIGVITNKTDCDVPVTSYAAAYPAALVAMTSGAQLMIRGLSGTP